MCSKSYERKMLLGCKIHIKLCYMISKTCLDICILSLHVKTSVISFGMT